MKAKLLTTLILLFCVCSSYAAGAVDITSGNVINPSFENDDITKLTPKTESADGLRGYIQTQPVGAAPPLTSSLSLPPNAILTITLAR